MKTILLVDDEKFSVDMNAKMISKAGDFKIIPAYSVDEGVQVLRGDKVDLIILDIIMRDASGVYLLETVRADETLKHIPVIMLSSMYDEDVRKTMIEKGANAYFGKTEAVGDRQREYLDTINKLLA